MADVNNTHTGTVVGKLEGEPKMIKGFYKTLFDLTTKHTFTYGLDFLQELPIRYEFEPTLRGLI